MIAELVEGKRLKLLHMQGVHYYLRLFLNNIETILLFDFVLT